MAVQGAKIVQDNLPLNLQHPNFCMITEVLSIQSASVNAQFRFFLGNLVDTANTAMKKDTKNLA